MGPLNPLLETAMLPRAGLPHRQASELLWQYLEREETGLLRAVCPFRSRDFYHTCYCLSGLSIAQHFGSGALLHDVVMGVPENALVRQVGVPLWSL